MAEITTDETIILEISAIDHTQMFSPVQDIKAAQKEILKVAVPTVTVSSVGIVGLPIQKNSDHGNHINLLLIVYNFAISTTLIFGLALLLLCLLLARVPRLASLVKTLVWVTMALLHIALFLKIGIHAIA